MAEEIKHSGIVLNVEGDTARIKILQTSACASCKAKEMCVSSESQEKIIEAIPLEALQPGDRVTVSVHEYLAWKAILLGYIMPFVVMILVIIILNALTSLDETITGTLSLCSIAVYYLILRLFRNKLQKQFSITAQKEQ